MSVHERSSPGPKPYSDPPPPPAAAIQPDPLLKSGNFIEASVTNGGAGVGAETCRGSPATVSGNSNFAGMETPVKNPAMANTDSPVDSGKRSRKRASESSSAPASDSSSWLPPGWLVEDRVRNSGATAGVVDKYYVDPVSGHRFRSKKEVFYFLETGSKRKKSLKGNPDADSKSADTPKRKGSGSRGKKSSAASKFDYADVPEGVRWVLTDASTGTWTPFIGEEKVAESKRIEWAAAFQSLSER